MSLFIRCQSFVTKTILTSSISSDTMSYVNFFSTNLFLFKFEIDFAKFQKTTNSHQQKMTKITTLFSAFECEVFDFQKTTIINCTDLTSLNQCNNRISIANSKTIINFVSATQLTYSNLLDYTYCTRKVNLPNDSVILFSFFLSSNFFLSPKEGSRKKPWAHFLWSEDSFVKRDYHYIRELETFFSLKHFLNHTNWVQRHYICWLEQKIDHFLHIQKNLHTWLSILHIFNVRNHIKSLSLRMR